MGRYFILIMLFCAGFGLKGWSQNGQPGQGSIKDIQIRPNSRDYLPSHRNNLHQRPDLASKRLAMKKSQSDLMKGKAVKQKQSLRGKGHSRMGRQNNKAVQNQQKMMMQRRMRR